MEPRQDIDAHRHNQSRNIDWIADNYRISKAELEKGIIALQHTVSQLLELRKVSNTPSASPELKMRRVRRKFRS